MPSLRGICRTLWFAYLISYPFGVYTTYLALAACLLTMMKYLGTPKLNLESAGMWFQSAMNVDEFHCLTYMLATMMAPSSIFVNGPIILTAVINAVTELRNMVVQTPSLPLLSNPTIKGYLDKAASY